jgi:glycosyltransferase involved in cell wall biosynthesis
MRQESAVTTPGLSIIIPAYDEENGIGRVLEHLINLMRQTDLVYEIIVVDDGSQDNTSEVIQKFEEVTLYRHRFNRGYGAALKTGIRQAQYDLVCITDADGTYPNERIPDLVAHLLQERLDMVVGARTGANVSIPLIRRPAKWFIRKLSEIVASQPIADINSGLRVLRRSVALRFFNILPDTFSFTTTITLGMLTNAYLVDYIPINYHARIGRSKIRPIRDTLNFVQLILRAALYFAPLKIFLPLSLLLLVTAFLWGIFSIIVLGAFADNSTFLLAMTSLQTGMLGMLAELINQRSPSHYRNDDSPD